ncbi:MAG: DHH family phosphoesterase [Bacteroidetes bacterium]|nr:DHH family phosphoesterase [Bacteroidota bacterium]
MNLLSHSINYFQKLVSEPANILVVSHYNPDGDTIGASLALYHFLKKKGHRAHVLVPNDPPGFLKWMPGSEELIIYQADNEYGNQLIQSADSIFYMDFNSSSRVKFFSEQLIASHATKVLIDHHLQPENEFDMAFSVTAVSSTSELLFMILEEAGYGNDVSKEMSECLFIGIMTDTGSFSYACNRPETFQVTAKLIATGIDIEKLHRLVYDTYSESRMRLLGHCLSDRLKVLPELGTAYIWLTRDDLERFEYQSGDTEGVVNYALSIEKISLAALFTERDDRIRLSLRSKGNFSVNEMARKHFNGGGHRNAAGGDSFESMEQTLATFESLLQEYKQELEHNLLNYHSKAL